MPNVMMTDAQLEALATATELPEVRRAAFRRADLAGAVRAVRAAYTAAAGRNGQRPPDAPVASPERDR